MNHNHTHEAGANGPASLMSNDNTPGEAMNKNTNATSIPAEHEETVCSGGGTLCDECLAAGADCGTV